MYQKLSCFKIISQQPLFPFFNICHLVLTMKHSKFTERCKKLQTSCCQVDVSDVVFYTNVCLQVASLALIALSAFTTYWLLRNPKLSNTSVLKGDNYGLWVYCIAPSSPDTEAPPCEYISGFPGIGISSQFYYNLIKFFKILHNIDVDIKCF